MDQGKGGSLEETPTWAVSVFALFFFFLSFVIDSSIHHLTTFLNRRRRKSLNRALMKFKTEMMKLGFVSLLLTISEVPISKICVAQTLADTFLPCKYVEDAEPAVSSATQLSGSNSTTFSKEVNDENYCEAKGMVSLVSREGVLQLNIFISMLAVFHVLYCILTMFLGMAKMRKWNAWEDETQTLEYQIRNDSRRFQLIHQTPFGKRHLKFWSKHPLLLWPVCFARQFSGSISKADYMTLRNGFIEANFTKSSNFNFLKFLARAFDDDFEQVVGIRFWIWLFSILFIFSSAHVFYNHYWLPFIPLLIVLVVGAKLEMIITKMCVESCKNPVIRGCLVVKLNDDLFWFGRPHWLLHLIQFVLIQNSFQLAFLTWTWFQYGQGSCLNRKKEVIAIRISMGLLVQFICGYVTLPLHALVTQMGSGMKKAVFTERVVNGLKNWHKNARHRLSKSRSISKNSVEATDFSISDQMSTEILNFKSFPHSVVESSPCTSEIIEEKVPHNSLPKPDTTSVLIPEIAKEEENPKINGKMITYDGEISFGSSWKLESSKRSGVKSLQYVIDEDHDVNSF
ncbi:PREDICTED: MLO [Prunus dulcis]|uniref:MLO-like protein n=1 Tax=Prunus dulcis TaxID=3755 RepID=A0A5E4G9C1_PRUDU|nr:MLO-like protein 12 [Prunus dulcis]VVA36401.1 PREDICTED: MLO [Prunus dulcis]